MYFGDSLALQTALSNDLTILLKNLKIREDQHFDLLQYNKKIALMKRDIDSQLFVNDEIVLHHQFLNKMVELEAQLCLQQKQFGQKYEGLIVRQEEVLKLMGRVGARIIETCQSSLDKIKSLDEDAIDRHFKMKNSLVKFINQKDKIELGETIALILSYTKHKLLLQIQKLKKLIKSLQDGQIQKLEEIYYPKKRKVLITKTVQRHKQKSVQKKSISKQVKSPLRQDSKISQARKLKQKTIAKLNGLYSTMDLSKQYYEDMQMGDAKERCKRMYQEIFGRNKFNYDQIISFEAKTDQFYVKVKQFQEMMRRQSLRIELIMREQQKVEQKAIQHCQSMPQIIQDKKIEKIQINPEIKTQRVIPRYKISQPKPKKQFRQSSHNFTTNHKLKPENFINLKFQESEETLLKTNRAKLPEIGAKRSSFQQRIQFNKNRLAVQQKQWQNSNNEVKFYAAICK